METVCCSGLDIVDVEVDTTSVDLDRHLTGNGEAEREEPVARVGVVVVDEEHDASLRRHARRVATVHVHLGRSARVDLEAGHCVWVLLLELHRVGVRAYRNIIELL